MEGEGREEKQLYVCFLCDTPQAFCDLVINKQAD